MLAVLGSVALRQHIHKYRDAADLDIIGTYEEIETFIRTIKKGGEVVKSQYPINSGKEILIKTDKRIIEATVAWPDSPAEALMDVIDEEGTSYIALAEAGATCVFARVPSINLLYLLKMSHRYLNNSPHFLKTMQDIQLMRMNGAVILPEHEEFYAQRMKDTYVYKHPKLDVGKGSFFNDDVPYTYDHDSIHEAVKHLQRPAYEYFKPADSEVMVSKEMFDNLDEQVKLYSVLEEVYVLALERSQIPYPETDKKRSFDIAHMKVCSSITSGWWREYAWENYEKVQAMYNEQYVDEFWVSVSYGEVKLHNKEK